MVASIAFYGNTEAGSIVITLSGNFPEGFR